MGGQELLEGGAAECVAVGAALLEGKQYTRSVKLLIELAYRVSDFGLSICSLLTRLVDSTPMTRVNEGAEEQQFRTALRFPVDLVQAGQTNVHRVDKS